VHEILLRGTLVSGASRFRWPGWQADLEGLRALLETFPGDDPGRPFRSAHCIRAVLHGGRQPIHIPREAGARKPLLRKLSFWDVLMDQAASGDIRYLYYSYRDRADCYRLDVPLPIAGKLRDASEAVKYSSLRDRIRTEGFAWAELYVEREPQS